MTLGYAGTVVDSGAAGQARVRGWAKISSFSPGYDFINKDVCIGRVLWNKLLYWSSIKMSGKTPRKVEDMTPGERLQSLRDFAEEKKYVRPGEDGTLPRGPLAMQSLVFGGPMPSGPAYSTPLPPPSYETVTGQAPVDTGAKKGPIGKWVEKRREKKAKKVDGELTKHES